MSWTIDDFVEDCVSNGRTLQEIMAIALGTHWWSQREEVEAKAKELLKNLKKKNKKP